MIRSAFGRRGMAATQRPVLGIKSVMSGFAPRAAIREPDWLARSWRNAGERRSQPSGFTR